MADETEQMIWQGGVWSGMFVHREYCRYTTGRSPFESGPVQVSSLMKMWIVVCGDQDDAAGREVDDLVVTCGNDDTDLNLRTIRDLTILGRYVVAESATEVSWCAYEACSAWDGSAGQKYDAEYDVADDLTSAFSSDLSKGATEYFDSDFESILLRTRSSNTTSDRDLD